MAAISDINYLVSTQQEHVSNTIEFEFDDSHVDLHNQTSGQTAQQEDQSLLQVLNDSTEKTGEIHFQECDENNQNDLNDTNVHKQTQGETHIEDCGILEERLSDFEEYEEERLSDYEVTEEVTNDENVEHHFQHNENTSFQSPKKVVYQSCSKPIQKPNILNFSLRPPVGNQPFHLPIIKKPPIIITSKSISKSDMVQRKTVTSLNTVQILREGIKRSGESLREDCTKEKQPKFNLKNSIARSFKVVTSSKTLTNSMAPSAVITKNRNSSSKIIINEDIQIKKEDKKNGTNYDSDSEVLLGFDTQSGSFRTKTGVKLESAENFESEKQEKSISAADFDSFEQSFHNQSSKNVTDSDISISDNSAIIKRPDPETPKLMNQITRQGSRTVITKVMPRFVPPKYEEGEEKSQRTSEELHVALAMQKLKVAGTKRQKARYSVDQRSNIEYDSEEANINLALARFFMECNIPLGVVEDSNFKEFVKLLRPSYAEKLPASKDLLQSILKL